MSKNFVSILIDSITTKMFQFKGRSNKKEFIIFTIFEIVAFTLIYMYLQKIEDTPTTFDFIVLIIGLLLIFVHFFSHMSLTIRRLHDFGLKGWWYLLNFIFSPAVFLIFCFIKGNKDKNKYGPPPND